jgi:hypothetical protein
MWLNLQGNYGLQSLGLKTNQLAIGGGVPWPFDYRQLQIEV